MPCCKTYYIYLVCSLCMMVSSFSIDKTLLYNTRLKGKFIDFEFMDEAKPPEGYHYWNDPRIHTLGNDGFGGYIHSLVSPSITRIIDMYAYNGVDIRNEIISEWNDKNIKILDICCGTGLSTPNGATGVDTSKHMIRKAKKINSKHRTEKHFEVGNAETWGSTYQYDLVICMFSFHEMPHSARIKVLENCIRITSERVVIIDIDPNYSPSKTMLAGEPYLPDYLKYIDREMKKYNGLKTVILKDHVVRWDFYKTL